MTATQHHTAESPESRRDQVFTWRRSQLVRSGFPEELAERVALDSRYDLYGLTELVAAGCEPELALRILAPLEDVEAA